ncbi:hypothetical protein QAD02_021510 [Eretmocerus hayati]|uniref:Uncharacterized protein n=2 Tax=Eretmocerus hayati TaxID=131215 RepID=A0ACC2PQM6_9HYME|nr:hypothetical protein QAD02_021508 [Eretmocerus hayati]KAJ8685717.1 hypothetical protein QAD02_021510 [Eretmocerus hayati]
MDTSDGGHLRRTFGLHWVSLKQYPKLIDLMEKYELVARGRIAQLGARGNKYTEENGMSLLSFWIHWVVAKKMARLGNRKSRPTRYQLETMCHYMIQEPGFGIDSKNKVHWGKLLTILDSTMGPKFEQDQWRDVSNNQISFSTCPFV